MKQLTSSHFAWCCHLLILAGTLASQGAESPDNVPLAKELSNGGRLEVVYAIIGTNALSGEEIRLLAVADSKGVAVHFPSELRASLACTNGIRAPIWTNRSEMRSQSPSRPYLRIHTAYDAVMTSGVVWVCYNERGAIWIERIHPVPSTGQRQRQFLVGSGSEVLPMDAWTNGVFNSVSEQTFELHLQGDRGSKLIWRLDGNLWRLNRQASAPEPISRHAAASSYSYEYVGGRWDKRMLVSCLPPNDDSSAPDD